MTAFDLQPVPGIMNPIGAARILVPTDFSDSSHAALEYGCTLARAFGARLAVLHVEPRGDQNDLIGMGSHGQTGAPVPPGHVPEHVLYRATCPVLTIPSWTRFVHHAGAIWSVQSSSIWAS